MQPLGLRGLAHAVQHQSLVPVSTTEWTASVKIADLPVIQAPRSFAMATSRFPVNAS